MVGEYQAAFLVRLSSNRYCHPSVFEREVGIGWRVRPLVRTPFPGRRESPVLDGRANHPGARARPRAPIRSVFEALLDPEQLVQWWGDDPRVEAELGGRYEGTFSDGRIEGSITAIDGPGQLWFMWPIPQEGGSVETSVAYELAPKGPETFVHVVHRAPKPLAGGWTDFWNAALESLRAFLEASARVSE